MYLPSVCSTEMFISKLRTCIIKVLYCSVGESARRPIGNLYKLDGKIGTVYSGQERGTRHGRGAESYNSAEGDQISHRKRGSKGVSGQMERNVEVQYVHSCLLIRY